MKAALRKLILLFAALSLLGAQQAAFAHWAAHLGAPAQVVLESPEGANARALSLTQFCSSCAAFAGIDAAVPPAGLPPSLRLLPELVAAAAPHPAVLLTTRHFDSRAPPAVL